MKEESNLIFIYGTLLKGLSNHHVLHYAKGEFIQEDSINATIFSYGPFPVVDIKTGGEVYGEVYSVGDFSPLDRLEGAPDFYNRTIVKTKGGLDCWVYHIPEKDRDTLKRLKIVECGNWKKHIGYV